MLGLLTKKESKSILKSASDDADTLSLAHGNSASVGQPDSESMITSKLDDTEFDFDFEIINTVAYRKVFNKVRSKLSLKKGSQAVILPYPPTSSGAGASETATLRSINSPAAIHAVVASHENISSSRLNDSSRSNDSSRDVGSGFVLSKDPPEGAFDGLGWIGEKQLNVDLEDRPLSSPKRSESLFGEYTIGETIGTGQSGEVKLAWKKDHKLPVAIKFIEREPTASHTNHTWKIRHDFAILKDLSHPNIIRLHEMLKTESHLAVVLEHIPGGTLAEYIAMHIPLSDRVSQRVFAQIVSGVGYLHQRAIVRLGLSCSKVLLDSNKNAILTGFSNLNTFDLKDTDINSATVQGFSLDQLERSLDPLDQPKERSFISGDSDPMDYAYFMRDHLYEGEKADVYSCGVMLVSIRYDLTLDAND